MPWKGTTVADERVEFIESVLSDLYKFSELCERYQISRRVGYKWVTRHWEEGVNGLEDRSRRPKSNPRATDPDTVQKILEARKKHPTWGPAKLLAWLAPRNPGLELPAKSTAGEILKRNGLIEARHRSPRRVIQREAIKLPERPNQLWPVDFKGQFLTGDGRYCYPLTMADRYSRFVLAIQGLPSTAAAPAWAVFKRVFQEYGLPEAILSDNGGPFSSQAIGGLSQLSVRWIKLGITHILTEPGHPEQNGSLERMHRTLKAETTRPPGANCGAQQKKFIEFRAEFNTERPHEALGQVTPASLYTPSLRPYPTREPEIAYPGHFEVRKVAQNGTIKWRNQCLFLTEVLSHESVGLQEVDDGIWALYFSTILLAKFDQRDQRLYT